MRNSFGERNIREHNAETWGPLVMDFKCWRLCGFLPRSSGIRRAVIDLTFGRREASGRFFVTSSVDDDDSGVLKAWILRSSTT